jgi:signal transduction histidine kinase
VEAAAYFVVAEALANVARYSEASHATVTVRREADDLLVQVRDDGRGGADPEKGSGLRGLADRLAALDGELDVVSLAGEGTIVRAQIPCG